MVCKWYTGAGDGVCAGGALVMFFVTLQETSYFCNTGEEGSEEAGVCPSRLETCL